MTLDRRRTNRSQERIRVNDGSNHGYRSCIDCGCYEPFQGLTDQCCIKLHGIDCVFQDPEASGPGTNDNTTAQSSRDATHPSASDGQDATRIIGDDRDVPSSSGSRRTVTEESQREIVRNNDTAPAVNANQNAQQPSWMETTLSEQAEIMDERYTHSRMFIQEDIVEAQVMSTLPDARRETPEGSTHSTSEPEDENSPMRPYQLD